MQTNIPGKNSLFMKPNHPIPLLPQKSMAYHLIESVGTEPTIVFTSKVEETVYRVIFIA